MSEDASLPVGQLQARTRWNTHASGAEFDRKKTTYLTEKARAFIAQQAFCTVTGLDVQGELIGSLVMSNPGFVQTPNAHTCLLRIDHHNCTPQLLQALYDAYVTEHTCHVGLFFIFHPTRERLCVQGKAELLSSTPRTSDPAHLPEITWIRLTVQQAFFHCTKYVKTSIQGLTAAEDLSPEQQWHFKADRGETFSTLSEEMYAFIAKQVVCFLCSVDCEGRCAINHRGGSAGFLAAFPPDALSLGGKILLPDYAGNGAFEAIGNILETGQVALVIPNYVSQVALCISGQANVLEVSELTDEQAKQCIGAERVVALSVQRVVVQNGDWSNTLEYENKRAQVCFTPLQFVDACPVDITLQ